MPLDPETLEELTKEVHQRLVPLPTPSDIAKFNPLDAGAKELKTFGYPQRPAEGNTTAFEIWRALVSGPLPQPGGAGPVLPLVNAGDVDYQLNYSQLIFNGR